MIAEGLRDEGVQGGREIGIKMKIKIKEITK
jgi:hypothetical protein